MSKISITKSKRTRAYKQKVQTNEFDQVLDNKYQALFDSNMIGVASTDFSDTIFKANDAFLSIIGYSKRDLQNKKLRWSTIEPEEFAEEDIRKVSELFKHGSIIPFEKEYIHKKGHLVPVLVGAETLVDNMNYGICFAVDISHIKELERRKDDFIGMVTHELRTPLSVMKLYNDLLHSSIDKTPATKELRDYATEINSQIDKLNLLITNLFNMAKMEADIHILPNTTINLSDTINNIVSDLDLINNRKLVYKSEPKIFVNAHKVRIEQVITNLVNNAIRYSDPKKKIIIRVIKQKTKAVIEVKDFGMGIKEDNLEKIFERHYRVNHADEYARDGAGIGLYISREIIKNHGGKLFVKSKIGYGSTFTIELPIV